MAQTSRRTYKAGVKQVADNFGVSPNAIRRLMARGEIPFIRVGNQYRFDVDEVTEHFARTSTHA